MKQLMIVRICAYCVLTLCILAGALTYATSVFAEQQITAAPAASRHASDDPMRLAFVNLPGLQHGARPAQSRSADGANEQEMNHILGVIFWFLGSAVMAMVGYKRMRYSDPEDQDATR